GESTVTGIHAGNTFTPMTISGDYDSAYLLTASTGTYGASWDQASNVGSCSSTAAFKPATAGLFSIVQRAYLTPQTPTSQLSVTFPSAQTSGNLNIVAIGWYDTTYSISSVTDTSGNAYQIAGTVQVGPAESQAIYYATNIKGAAAGANTVKVTFSNAVDYPDV